MKPIFLWFPASGPALRRGLRAAMAIATAGLVAGCDPSSMHPLATPADTTFDEHFRGRWLLVTFPQDSLQFARADIVSGTGSVFVMRDSAVYRELGIRFAHLGGFWFADAQLKSWRPEKPGSGAWQGLERSAREHMLLRLEFRSDTLAARQFAGGLLEDYHALHPGELGLKVKPSTYRSEYFLTDDTPKLRRFVASVAGVDSMFNDNGLRFVRAR